MLKGLQITFKNDTGTELTISELANSKFLRMWYKTQPNKERHPILTELVIMDLTAVKEFLHLSKSISTFYKQEIDNEGKWNRSYQDITCVTQKLKRRLPVAESLQIVQLQFEIDFEDKVNYSVVKDKNRILSYENVLSGIKYSLFEFNGIEYCTKLFMKIKFQNI